MSEKSKSVYIAHHFDEMGRERAALLADILNLLNIVAVYGENLGGQKISEGVQGRIASAGLVVALLTRDVQVGEESWQPSQWMLQEVTWAVAINIPCLLVVEEGVQFDGGLLGDLEQIRFAPEEFPGTLVRIANQVQALMLLNVDIPGTLPSSDLSDRVRLLIVEARERARKGRFDEVLRLSEEALGLDSSAWQAMLNKGVALVHLGHLAAAEKLFLRMAEDYEGGPEWILARVYHNLGWVEEVRDAGRLNPKSLRKQARYLEKSLTLNHRSLYTRALLLLCRAALGEMDEANFLLMDSLKYRGFIQALRREIETKGAVGHRLLRKLPDWLYSLLFPTWGTGEDDDGEDEN